jgi:hypothetical protein
VERLGDESKKARREHEKVSASVAQARFNLELADWDLEKLAHRELHIRALCDAIDVAE